MGLLSVVEHLICLISNPINERNQEQKKQFHKNDASLKTAFLRLYLENLTPRQNPLTSGRQKCCDQVGNNMT